MISLKALALNLPLSPFSFEPRRSQTDTFFSPPSLGFIVQQVGELEVRGEWIWARPTALITGLYKILLVVVEKLVLQFTTLTLLLTN